MEQPMSANLVRAAGVASPHRLRVDAQGALFSGAGDMRAAVICPDGNQPLGTVMSAGRRVEALEWAKPDRYVIEASRDVVLDRRVTSLGCSAREIVLGDFREILTSSLRLGYALVPREIAPKLGRLIAERGEQPSWVIQRALADLLRSGAIAQQMHQLTKLYADKRAIVDSELASLRLPVRHGIEGVVLIGHPHAATTVARLLTSGIRVQTLDSYGLTPATEGGEFVIGYGHLPNAQLSRGLSMLVSLLR
jgi:GntR family transcriptional regulator/MocR family aminotransferase